MFRYGTIGGNHESLDPAVDYETVGGEILQNVYETLVFYNGASSSDLKPMLAAEMPWISEDGLTYNFTLRQGVMFSDNKTEMTAEDVKYSFDRGLLLNDPHGPFWMYGAYLIPDYYDYGMASFDSAGNMVMTEESITQEMCDAAIWAKGKYEVQFNLTTPYAPFLSALAFNAGSIVSKAYVEEHGGLTKAGYDHMASNTFGTGPYVLEEYKVDSYYKLVANEAYWRGVANIKTVMIEMIPDTNSRIMALKNGELDAAYVPRDQIGSVENVEGLMINKGNPTFNIDFLGLNLKINKTGLDPSLTNVPSDFFDDRNVRLAFMHAFNYGLYINETMQGMAIQPNGAIPKGMFGYSDDVPKYNYDLAKAKEYLETAETNWVEQGFKLEVFFNNGNTARETACMQIKAGLEALAPGKITVTVTGLEWSKYLDYRKDGQMPAMFLGWAPDFADPDNYLQPFYHSAGTYASMIGYSNATLDAAIEAAAVELDPEVRAQMYEDLMYDMYEEALFAWTAQATNFFVGQDYIQGYYFNPMFSNLYYYDLDKPDTLDEE
ncbi:hypothetical protein AOA80_06450 [Methanomassiliicoccales archaeon RumEn M1]|nr:hypothetical protein AOA80_06450 [Methanomassiliicoccales archaeon RumEn M1]